MAKILAVTTEMEARASDIGTKADSILDIQNAVTNIFQSLGRDFSGRIPSLMTEKMIAMEDIYQGINGTLNGYAAFLSDAAKNYDLSDREGARWARSLNLGGGN